MALPAAHSWVAFGLIAAAMAVGGLLAGRRVLATLARKITTLPLSKSLAASGAAAVHTFVARRRYKLRGNERRGEVANRSGRLCLPESIEQAKRDRDERGRDR